MLRWRNKNDRELANELKTAVTSVKRLVPLIEACEDDGSSRFPYDLLKIDVDNFITSWCKEDSK